MRLWPLSRQHYPKQFVCLFDELSMLQHTLVRLRGLQSEGDALAPLVLCNEAHRFLVQEQSQAVGVETEAVILEPCIRDTAPALTLAALHEAQSAPDTLLLMLPSDQHIADVSAFQEAVRFAATLSASGNLVSFGIPATCPETGYGYIRHGEPAGEGGGFSAHQVEAFTEKPDLPTASRYLREGGYQWNSGMFLLSASLWCAQLARLHGDMHEACRKALQQASRDGVFIRPDADAFAACRAKSVDYAVMEPLAKEGYRGLLVVPVQLGWSDIGSWRALWERAEKDADNNHIQGDVLTEDVRDCELRAGHRLLTVLGCRDLVIVETADSVMVADKWRSEQIKQLVARLQEQKREEALSHRRVCRPWGSYEVVDAGERFQVKRIVVKPDCQLSLQYHNQRSEHWIVVKGTAQVTRGEETFALQENQSTWVPQGMPHRLANRTEHPLEIIEIQSGAYLGEDDIVRLEDDFGRV